MYPNLPKPTEKFICNHCKTGAVEFNVLMIYSVDEYGQRINERNKREVRCNLCGNLAVVVKTDQKALLEEERIKQLNPNVIPETVNETFVEEEAKMKRGQTINLTQMFSQGGNRSPVSIDDKVGNLTPIEEFKKNFRGF
jgi:hypothetical protein